MLYLLVQGAHCLFASYDQLVLLLFKRILKLGSYKAQMLIQDLCTIVGLGQLVERKSKRNQFFLSTFFESQIKVQKHMGICLFIQKDRGNSNKKLQYVPFVQKYQVLEKLGYGKYSTVFKVKCLASGTLYSAKVISLKRLPLELATAIKQSSLISLQLKPKGMLQVIQVFEYMRTLCMIEQLMDLNLLQVMTKSTLSQRKIKSIFKAILNILVQLQAMYNFYHYNLKPSNIMFKKSQNQFMSIKLAHPLYQFQERKYSLYQAYFLPKQNADQDKFDVWTIGCILYLVVSAQLVVKGMQEKDFIKSVQNLKFKEWLNPSLKNLLANMLKKKKSRPTLLECSQDRWFQHQDTMVFTKSFYDSLKLVKIGLDMISVINRISGKRIVSKLSLTYPDKHEKYKGESKVTIAQIEKEMRVYLGSIYSLIQFKLQNFYKERSNQVLKRLDILKDLELQIIKQIDSNFQLSFNILCENQYQFSVVQFKELMKSEGMDQDLVNQIIELMDEDQSGTIDAGEWSDFFLKVFGPIY